MLRLFKVTVYLYPYRKIKEVLGCKKKCCFTLVITHVGGLDCNSFACSDMPKPSMLMHIYGHIMKCKLKSVNIYV